MKLIRLNLTDFRGFLDLEVMFDPHLTILVGVNGAGKTTILDAVAAMLSFLTEPIRDDNASGARLAVNDIHRGSGLAVLSMAASIDGRDEGGEPTMKVAHRASIDSDPSRALDWKNLLGSCDGGQRSGERFRTCDYAQEATALSVDPTDRGCVAKLRYERRNRPGLFITSEDPALRCDVDERPDSGGRATPGTLRLNAGELPELREKAWLAFLERWRRDGRPHGDGRPAWRAYFPKWLARSGATLPEMLGVIEERLHR